MRYGKKRISKGVITLMVFLLFIMTLSSFLLWAEITGFSFPKINTEQPAKEKKKKSSNRG